MDIYARIKELRNIKKLTQTELAHKTGYKDKTAIAKIEAGKIDIPQSKIKAFADALGCSVSYLLDGYDENDTLEAFVNMSQADKQAFLKRALLYMQAYQEKVTESQYPVTMQLTDGEAKLIKELRERTEINTKTLEQMFNTILHYKQNEGTLTIDGIPADHRVFMVTEENFAPRSASYGAYNYTTRKPQPKTSNKVQKRQNK